MSVLQTLTASKAELESRYRAAHAVEGCGALCGGAAWNGVSGPPSEP